MGVNAWGGRGEREKNVCGFWLPGRNSSKVQHIHDLEHPDGRDEKSLCSQILIGLDQETRQSLKDENYQHECLENWSFLIKVVGDTILQ